MNRINNDVITKMINELKGNIIKLQNPNGWYPFAIFKERSIACIWATGEAVASLSQTDITFESEEVCAALKWLASCQRDDGGWGAMLQEKSSVESTTWVIIGLSKFESEYHDTLIKAVKWLKANQNEDGGWGSWKQDESRIVTTALSIVALSFVGRGSQELNNATKWLKANQNEDGGWSFGFDYKSNVPATSYALIALLNVEKDKNIKYIRNAIEFLKQHQHDDGFFGDEIFTVEVIGRETGIVRWQYFNTPLSILALSMAGSIDIALFKGIKWLIDNQVVHNPTPSAISFPFHNYVTLYCIAKASELIDSNRFEIYSDMVSVLEDEESEAQFLSKKRRLKRLIIENALLLGDFKLFSKIKSNYYFDMKRVTQDPEASEIIADIFLYLTKNKNVDSVGGLEMGAVPLSTAISMRSHNTKRPITAFFVREQRKGHGTKRKIDGILRKKSNVILVDDVTTTGSSILKAIDEVEKEGCNVKGVFTIVDRCEGGGDALRKRGYELESMFDISEFEDIISPKDVLK